MSTTTKYLTGVFRWLNELEGSGKAPAFPSEWEPTQDAFKKVKELTTAEDLMVLDLGCGPGNILSIARDTLGIGNRFVGVDNNQTYVSVAKRVDGRFNIQLTDIFSNITLKFMQEADVIFSYMPFPSREELSQMYTRLTDNIKTGALFVCNDNGRYSLEGFEILDRIKGTGCCDPTDIRIFKKL